MRLYKFTEVVRSCRCTLNSNIIRNCTKRRKNSINLCRTLSVNLPLNITNKRIRIRIRRFSKANSSILNYTKFRLITTINTSNITFKSHDLTSLRSCRLIHSNICTTKCSKTTPISTLITRHFDLQKKMISFLFGYTKWLQMLLACQFLKCLRIIPSRLLNQK